MWRQYFKTPFENDFDCYIMDAEGHPVANFCHNLTHESCDRIVECLNDKYTPVGGIEFSLSEDKSKILNGKTEYLLIRGWGYLTGTGGCHLPMMKAVQVQNSLAEFICNKLSNKK